jgi:hypothetical protein
VNIERDRFAAFDDELVPLDDGVLADGGGQFGQKIATRGSLRRGRFFAGRRFG